MSQLSKKPSKQPLNQSLNQPEPPQQPSFKPSVGEFIKHEWRLLLVAMQFLTRLPARTAICQLQSAVVAPEQPSFSWGRFIGWNALRWRILAGQYFIYAIGRGSDKYRVWD